MLHNIKYEHITRVTGIKSIPIGWYLIIVENEDTLDLWATTNINLAYIDLKHYYDNMGETWVILTNSIHLKHQIHN